MNHQIVNGIRLAWKERGRGPVVLLVHGFPLDHGMWEAQIEFLAVGRRVIGVDLRGFGESEIVDGPATMEQMADDLAGLLDAMNIHEPVALAGLSMGGYVAFAFYRKYAHRLGSLILCDTRAAADSKEVVQIRHETARRVATEGMDLLLQGMMPRLMSPCTLRDKPETIEAVRRMIMGTDPRGASSALLGMAERVDSRGLLSQIACPTLVVVGRDDVLSTVDEMGAMARAIPQGRLIEIAEAGHLSPLEQPEAVSEAMGRFLADVG